MIDHIHTFMTKDTLKRKNISTIPKILNGACMAETVRIHIFYTNALPQSG
jgi:hypothetical protein